MATTTSRLALYKPADDGSEFVDVATNLNQNLDKLDAAVGFVPATSSTPPSPAFAGMGRHDNDTGKAYYRNGTNSAWLQLLNSGSVYDSDIKMSAGRKLGIGNTGTLSALIEGQHTDTSSSPARFRVSGDTEPRVAISWDGISFGPGGSTPTDISLSRAGAGELVVSNDLTVAGELNVAGLTTVDDLSISGNVTGNVNIAGNFSVTGAGGAIRKVKPSSTSRANTTTVTNDPDLWVNLEANSVYLIRFYSIMGAAQAGDMKTAWSVPSGSTGLKWCLGPDANATVRESVAMRTAIHVFGTEVPYGLASDTLYTGALEQGVVSTSGTAGTFAIQWAQVASNGTGTVMVNGSILEVIRIS